MNIRQALTQNLGVKLIAVVVAMFIWFNASGQQEIARIRSIPLAVKGLPDTLTLINSIPSEVEVNVSGTKRQLLTMGFKRVRVAIDLSDASAGRQRVTLTSRQVELPGGFDRRQVSVVSPGFVDLDIERVVTRRVPVSLDAAGNVSDGLVLLGESVWLDPPATTIRGAASRVARVASVPTAELDLGRVRGSVQREVALKPPKGISCDPDRVTVFMSVQEKGQRVLANVPPTVLVDSEDFVATVTPRTVSLTLEGAASVLDTLSSGDVSVLLNLSGRGPATYRLAPEVILPPGVVLARMNVDSVTVEIARASSSP